MSLNASIICIGTELTMGKNLDTNSQYLASQLFNLGISVTSLLNIPDDYQIMKRTVKRVLEDNDLLILTGGLGPTQDDITKDVIKDIFNLKTEYCEKVYKRISQTFKRRGWKVPEINKSQAYVLKEAELLQNITGTAPGYLVEKQKKIICLFPGPPGEMIPMFKKLIPFLRKRVKIKLYQYIIRMMGGSESVIAQKLTDIHNEIKKNQGELTILAKPNLIDIIISASRNKKKMAELKKKVIRLFKESIYSIKWESIEQVIANLLIKRKWTLSFAESCTGGLLSKTITDLPGSSQYYQFGITTYSNQAKTEILGVKSKTLADYGAVSKETCEEMLKGMKKIISTDVRIAITGIAGPDGGTKEKPVGLVYIGIGLPEKDKVYRFIFYGNRKRIRENVLNKVWELLYKKIMKYS